MLPACGLHPQGHANHSGQYLLGDAKQFCAGFYHMFPSLDGTYPDHSCLCPTERCAHANVMLLLKLDSFYASYIRCGRIHCERFMVEDRCLQRHLRTSFPLLRSGQTTPLTTKMILYSKYQPCHHSGGWSKRTPEGYVLDRRSCTETLLQFYHEWLEPRGVRLCMKVASLYKFFCLSSQDPSDRAAALQSIEGVHALMNAGIEVQAMQTEDWCLLGMLTQNVPTEALISERRQQTDRIHADLLQELRENCVDVSTNHADTLPQEADGEEEEIVHPTVQRRGGSSEEIVHPTVQRRGGSSEEIVHPTVQRRGGSSSSSTQPVHTSNVVEDSHSNPRRWHILRRAKRTVVVRKKEK